jgi:WD40 repeat protein
MRSFRVRSVASAASDATRRRGLDISVQWLGVVAIADAALYLWDLAADHAPVRIGTIVPAAGAPVFSTGGDRLTWLDADHGRRVYDLSGRRYLPTRPAGPASLTQLSPDLRTVAVAMGDRDRVRLWSVDAGRFTARLDYGFGGLAFSPDGRTLATVGWSERLRVWDVPSA